MHPGCLVSGTRSAIETLVPTSTGYWKMCSISADPGETKVDVHSRETVSTLTTYLGTYVEALRGGKIHM